MSEKTGKQSNLRDNFERRPVVQASLGMVFDAILGLIIGHMIGSLALGLMFGAGIGLICESVLNARRK